MELAEALEADMDAAVVSLHKLGFPLGVIAYKLRAPEGSVRRRAKRLGLKTRKQGRPSKSSRPRKEIDT